MITDGVGKGVFFYGSSGPECTRDAHAFYFRGLIIPADARESNVSQLMARGPHTSQLSRLDGVPRPFDTDAIKRAADSAKRAAMNGPSQQRVGCASVSASCRTEK